jgi:hypothetical protein
MQRVSGLLASACNMLLNLALFLFVACIAHMCIASLPQAPAGGAAVQQPGQQRRLLLRRCRTLAAVCCCLRVTGWSL